jgi:hypothetical protein
MKVRSTTVSHSVLGLSNTSEISILLNGLGLESKFEMRFCTAKKVAV